MASKGKNEPEILAQYEYKPVWVGFVVTGKRGVVDEEGLPIVIPESYGKQREDFKRLLDQFGEKGWEPHMMMRFPGGAGDYLIFKREKVM
ncbi:MAG: hypothetical protein DRP01_06670 [Archaeoglobales archaeon]|nr:MAG: hypothetical protein DRP01_06670 [Archaeoglobales archaeon]